MLHCANHWLRLVDRSLSDSQCSYRSDVTFMWEQVCSSEKVQPDQREVQQRVVATVTQGVIQVVSFHLREHIDHVCGSYEL